MKIKIKHTIETIIEEDSDNYELNDPNSPEELLEKVKEYIQDDADYVLGGLDRFTIKSEIIKE